MRTTVRIDETLLTEAKQVAARTGRTLTRVIEDALRAMLARAEQSAEAPSAELPTFGGEGTRPGVDLDDTAALLDLMEQPDDPA